MKNLPNECFFEIFNNFQDDSGSLYSCLLVNRDWCRNIVPILWGEITKKLNNRKLVNTCLLALNTEEQALLIPFKIPLPNYPKPLFNCTSYTTHVNANLSHGIIDWLNYNGYEKVNLKTYDSYNLVNVIKCSLISMFLRTSNSLESLEDFEFVFNPKLINYLCKNDTIISLSLYETLVFDSEKIAEILCQNTTLTSLNISGSNVGIEGGKVLANALHINTTLVSLNLSYDYLGIGGGKALAEVLCKNTTLTSLNLCGNFIGNEGGKKFAEALYTNTTLISLDLSHNQITSEGINALVDAVRENTTLVSLYIGGNQISHEIESMLKNINRIDY